MPRQTRNSRARLEVSTQTSPSLSRRATRERATSPIEIAANGNNVRFNLDDVDNAEDNVGNNDDLQNGENAAAHVQQVPQFPIAEGVDPATANLLNMQMTMMQTLMAQMERNYQANQFNLETRLDNERRERLELAKQLENRDSNGPKIVGKAPKFDLEKDRDNFETWKLKWADFLISSNINSINRAAVKEEQT